MTREAAKQLWDALSNVTGIDATITNWRGEYGIEILRVDDLRDFESKVAAAGFRATYSARTGWTFKEVEPAQGWPSPEGDDPGSHVSQET